MTQHIKLRVKNHPWRARNRERNVSWAWWYVSVIPALERLGREDCEIEGSLDYKVRSCLEKMRQTDKERKDG
jgi:hypothetical protein